MKNSILVRTKFFLRNQVVKNEVYCCASVVGVLGIIKTFELNSGAMVSNSLIPIVLFLAVFYMYTKLLAHHTKRETGFEVIFALLLSCLLVIGAELDIHSTIWWSFGTLGKVVCMFLYSYPFINVLMSFIQNAKLENFRFKSNKRLFWITFGIIFVGGFFVWLATYPGIWGYDAATQFAVINNVDESLTKSVGAHYSLPLGGLMSGIMAIGNTIFGSYQGGLALCSFLQLLFLSYVATRIVLHTTTKTKNIYLYMISVAFFAIFPLYTAMTVYMTQDTVFGGIFALAFINLCDMVTDETYWKKKYKPVLLSVLFLLLCLCRNNGFYCLIIAFVFAVLFVKHKRIAVTIVFAIPMTLYQVYNGPILKAFDVSTSSAIGEIMSIPSQQMARVYNYNRDAYQESDKEQLDKYYSGYKDFSEYMQYPSISDFTKRYIAKDNVSGDLTGYLKLWFKIGVRDPKNYIEAFLLNNIGFWYPNKAYPDTRMGIPYFEYSMTDRGDDRFLVIERDSKIAWYDGLLKSFLVDDSFVRVPILSTLCSAGTYLIIFLFAVGLSITKKHWKSFVPFGLVIGLVVTLLLSPVAVFRYAFPMVILWPIIVAIIFGKITSTSIRKTKKSMVE